MLLNIQSDFFQYCAAAVVKQFLGKLYAEMFGLFPRAIDTRSVEPHAIE